MLAAYAHAGHCCEAMQTLAAMAVEGIKCDENAFISILNGCSHSGLVEISQWCFQSMVADYNLVPWVEHFSCIVDVLGRSNCLHEAEELLHAMPFLPDVATWSSLLSASETHKDLGRAWRAAQHISKIDPSQGVSYVLLSNSLNRGIAPDKY
ncbi:hypothetical protein SELMODRAFT_107825 [Selaginella moellendorffii]|uniref:Pentacotripeptide-repeat region of PRORP domain-containing protein n=2 Tax=Selaginella moellendorffii TaxID=88036 RepID=D8S2Y1_SELML|nr:hypothetical protein SELMODRAFT_107825 [Selaginella moellendorffii]